MLARRGTEYCSKPAISAQHSALSNQRSAFSAQQSALSNQQSALSNQQSAISNQQSAISNQQSAHRQRMHRKQIIPAFLCDLCALAIKLFWLTADC
jgi:hypothetical protein